jgi:hypothetical protein
MRLSDWKHVPQVRLGIPAYFLSQEDEGARISMSSTQSTVISANFALACHCHSTHCFAGYSFELCAKKDG